VLNAARGAFWRLRRPAAGDSPLPRRDARDLKHLKLVSFF
jgi:hypothetical protein